MSSAPVTAPEIEKARAYGSEKFVLVCISLAIGFICDTWWSIEATANDGVTILPGGIIHSSPSTYTFNWKLFFYSSPLAVLLALLYAIAAGLTVGLCERLKAWAYRKKIERWDTAFRLLLAAFFPISLVCCLIVYGCLGVLHRIENQ